MLNSAPGAVARSAENGNLVVAILDDKIREAATAYRLRDEIISLLNDSKATNVVLDLAQVQFIGSVGFLAFLAVRRHVTGGRVVLCNASDPVRDMFAVCKLIATEANASAPFELATTSEAALARLSA